MSNAVNDPEQGYLQHSRFLSHCKEFEHGIDSMGGEANRRFYVQSLVESLDASDDRYQAKEQQLATLEQQLGIKNQECLVRKAACWAKTHLNNCRLVWHVSCKAPACGPLHNCFCLASF